MAITAKFEADFSAFKDSVASATASLTNMETTSKSLGAAIVAGLASAELRRFGSEVKQVASEFITAFAEEEAATNKLSQALKANGSFTPELLAQYQALGAEFQRTTVFSDDLMTEMEALMTQVGSVGPGQMRAALTAAADLSAGLGIDLRAATLAVAKGFEGGTTALVKMVPALKSIVKEGATMDEVMTAVNEHFGGQAQAQLDTYSGKVAQLGNQMNDFQEKVGGLLVRGLTPLVNAFSMLPESMQTVIVGVVAVATALAPLALSIGALTPLVTALAGVFGVTMAGALTALGGILLPAGLVIGGIIAVYLAFKNWEAIKEFVAGVYNAVKTYLVDRFTAVIDSIKQKVAAVTGFFKDMYDKVVGHSYVPDMVNGIDAEFQRLNDVMVAPAQQAADGVLEVFRSSAEAVVMTWQRAMDAVKAGTGTMSGTVQGFSADTAGGMTRYDDYNNPYTYVPGKNLPGKEYPSTRAGSGASISIDASYSFFDSPNSLQKLADKVIGAMGTRAASQGRA